MLLWNNVIILEPLFDLIAKKDMSDNMDKNIQFSSL